MNYADSQFADPADSHRSSYLDDPIDHLELPLDCHVRLDTAIEAIAGLGLSLAITQAIVDALTSIPDGEQVIAASRAAYSLRLMLGEIIGSKNPRLVAEAAGLWVGLLFRGNSESEIAVKHGVSRQDVSKLVVAYQLSHGIGRARGNKKIESKKIYRNGNSGRGGLKHK